MRLATQHFPPLCGLVLLALLGAVTAACGASPGAGGTPTPEPIVPTRTPADSVGPGPVPTSALPSGIWTVPTPRVELMGGCMDDPPHWEGRARVGFGLALGPAERFDLPSLQAGWYLDWTARKDPPRPGGVEYVQMVRLKGGKLSPDASSLQEIARANPGSLWLIGNEPDVMWQDNVTPEAYARLYAEAYRAIRAGDPTARVALGGISQPTPLRMVYLDRVLEAYREAFGSLPPVDAWHIHNFILREERGSWGVGIPPGFEEDRGWLYEVEDHGSLEIFARQIRSFRQWMADRGYRACPLIVSEYGILMPEDYGFPPEQVEAFLRETFAFFEETRDPDIGNPVDDGRLVQRWCWFSAADPNYPTGNLFDPETGALTHLGRAFRDFQEQR